MHEAIRETKRADYANKEEKEKEERNRVIRRREILDHMRPFARACVSINRYQLNKTCTRARAKQRLCALVFAARDRRRRFVRFSSELKVFFLFYHHFSPFPSPYINRVWPRLKLIGIRRRWNAGAWWVGGCREGGAGEKIMGQRQRWFVSLIT